MGESYSGVSPLVGERGTHKWKDVGFNCACSLITGYFAPDAGRSANLVMEHV